MKEDKKSRVEQSVPHLILAAESMEMVFDDFFSGMMKEDKKSRVEEMFLLLCWRRLFNTGNRMKDFWRWNCSTTRLYNLLRGK
ncbi:hypothetical protein V6N13_085198 [Hibiscus sabdariffa]